MYDRLKSLLLSLFAERPFLTNKDQFIPNFTGPSFGTDLTDFC